MAYPTPHSSPYYPPRAKWYSRCLYPVDSLQRLLALDRLQLPPEITTGGLVAGFFVPGLAPYLRSPKLWGKPALALACLLLLVFVIFLGRTIGTMAFTMLLSLHVTGFVYYCLPMLGGSLQRRLCLTLATITALSVFIYLPARNLVQSHLLMPMQIRDEVVVVRHLYPTEKIRVGDWVAYNIPTLQTAYRESIYVHTEIGQDQVSAFGPILAQPGDKVEFSKTALIVNGVSLPRKPYMPESGSLVVPEKQWFIWPDFAIHINHGNVADSAIANRLLSMALVAEDQLIGKPFHRWFWWQQDLS